jgi:hypothetical protein
MYYYLHPKDPVTIPQNRQMRALPFCLTDTTFDQGFDYILQKYLPPFIIEHFTYTGSDDISGRSNDANDHDCSTNRSEKDDTYSLDTDYHTDDTASSDA